MPAAPTSRLLHQPRIWRWLPDRALCLSPLLSAGLSISDFWVQIADTLSVQEGVSPSVPSGMLAASENNPPPSGTLNQKPN